MNIKDARKNIEHALRQDGSFTHNMLGVILSSVAKTNGDIEANKLIDEYDLTKRYGIHKTLPTNQAYVGEDDPELNND